jgi:hypothetical protein
MTNKFYFAPPRQGKTYVVVAEAIDTMKKGKEVYSNFPIITPDGKYISKVWKPEYIYENIQNATIIIDEAQRDFDSIGHKALDVDEDTFFAASGHNGLEIRVISQNLTRVAKAIRDRMNEFIFVQSGFNIPFLKNREGKWGRPFYFKHTSYLTLEDLESHDKERIYLTSRTRFTNYIANAYDTHFFKRDGTPFEPNNWLDELVIMKANNEMIEKIKKIQENIKDDNQSLFSVIKKRFKRGSV